MIKRLLIAFVTTLVVVSTVSAQGSRQSHPSNAPVRHTDVYVGAHHHEHTNVAEPYQVDLILEYIHGISFDRDKLKAAILCVQICPVRSSDIARVASLITFDSSRKEFLKEAYRYCPDPQHYHVAVETLTFNSSREEVYRYMRDVRR